MKRCPQCLFLYPETDERCDFDQTPLEVIDDAEIEAVTAPQKRRRRGKALPIAAAVAFIIGALAFAIYFSMSQKLPQASAAPEPASTPVTIASPDIIITTPLPSPSPSPSPSATPKTAANGVSSAHTRASTDPVSTSGPGIGSRQGGKPVIVLSSGGKIEADEVWRTKDGVWYRRNGIVTLLKRGQVKSIGTR